VAGKLTKSEFEGLLKKAAERDVHTGPRNFSAQELLEAGSELGISRDTILEVWREHEAQVAAQAPRPALVPRPRGSRVTVWRTGTQLIVQYGPRVWAQIACGMAVLMSGAFALLSFRVGWPLNLVGGATAALIGGMAMVAGFSSTRLELDRVRGRLWRGVGPFGWTRKLTTEGLVVRCDQELRQVKGNSYTARFVAIDDGIHTHELLTHHSVPEQRWVASEIEHWLRG
jgi:hypothetical protein